MHNNINNMPHQVIYTEAITFIMCLLQNSLHTIHFDICNIFATFMHATGGIRNSNSAICAVLGGVGGHIQNKGSSINGYSNRNYY